jgi:hypothetical protein
MVRKLEEVGKALGYKSKREKRTEGGTVDLVWLINHKEIPHLKKIPVVGFEIETSWRTRKHLKGDIFNLLALSPALGVILFLTKGFTDKSEVEGNISAAKRYAKSYSGISNIEVWTEEQVKRIYKKVLE